MIKLKNIPFELRKKEQWVNWIHHHQKGKIPIDSKTGQWAKSSDSTTWSNFGLAVTKINKELGLGFMVEEPVVAIDIDDCIGENSVVISQLAKDIINKFKTYTEKSPSKTGLHLFCLGTINKAYKKKGIEIYPNRRFMTITGDTLPGISTNLRECTLELNELIDTEFGGIKQRNKPGWVKDYLENLQAGNLHNHSISMIGKLHRDGWNKEEIGTLLLPHIQRVGGDLKSFEARLNDITAYPRLFKDTSKDLEIKDCDIETFLDSGSVEITWIVKDILAEQGLGIIAGLGSTRKTWMLMDMALEIAKGGGYWLGRFPVYDGKVLYIDQERPASETRRRFNKMIKAKNLTGKQLKDNLKIMSGSSITLNLDRSFEAFKRKIDALAPSIVMVDSLITFHSKEDNNRSEMQTIFEKIKLLRNEFNCAFLFLDHESKSVLSEFKQEEEPNAHDLSGSAGKVAACECVLTVRKNDTETSTVYHTKSTLGKAIEPFLVKVVDEDNTKTSIKAY